MLFLWFFHSYHTTPPLPSFPPTPQSFPLTQSATPQPLTWVFWLPIVSKFLLLKHFNTVPPFSSHHSHPFIQWSNSWDLTLSLILLPGYLLTDNSSHAVFSISTLNSNKELTLDPGNSKQYDGTPYPFGMDPMWQISNNKINFNNSYKMKISIIFGIIHMMFGVILSVWNHR